MAPTSGGVGGWGRDRGRTLSGGTERPRLYSGTRFNKVNFSLAKCDRGKQGSECHDSTALLALAIFGGKRLLEISGVALVLLIVLGIMIGARWKRHRPR